MLLPLLQFLAAACKGRPDREEENDGGETDQIEHGAILLSNPAARGITLPFPSAPATHLVGRVHEKPTPGAHQGSVKSGNEAVRKV